MHVCMHACMHPCMHGVPKSSWPLGRITSVHKNSTDEHVRSVTVKNRTLLYDRPVNKIVLLESVEMSEGKKHY